MRRARTSAPYGVQAWHACTHLQRPGGLPAAPTACSAREETVAAPCHQLRSVGVVEQTCERKTNARSILQRFEIFAWDLQRGPGLTFLRSPLRMRAAYYAMPRLAASLRAAFAPFFALANATQWEMLYCRCNASTAVLLTGIGSHRLFSPSTQEPPPAVHKVQLRVPGTARKAYMILYFSVKTRSMVVRPRSNARTRLAATPARLDRAQSIGLYI